jgi:uncharacterized lipoprotein
MRKSIEGVKDKDIIRVIREYNNCVKINSSSRLKSMPENITIMRQHNDWQVFETLVKFLQDNNYDATSYFNSSMKHLLTWVNYRVNVPDKKFYVRQVISKKMQERYESVQFKTRQVKEDPIEVSEEIEQYISSMKRKIIKAWGEEKGKVIIKYHLKDWEEDIRLSAGRLVMNV